MHKDAILKRIYDLASTGHSHEEKVQGTASLLALVYGQESTQLATFNRRMSEDPSASGLVRLCTGVLQNMASEIEAGLTGSLRQQIAGEVLTDLVQLSRSVLGEPGDKAKNVAAVLAAAAFEDTIRRMGNTLVGGIGQDDLADVLNKLKTSQVILGPQVGIAQSYLSFRNHALHANWDKIERESVHSVLGFVEQLLLKHFS
jgi:hypothetical protein